MDEQAEAIAASRPPDSVTYTDWERDPEDSDPPTRWRTIATVTSIFKVLESETIPEVMRRERRKRIETWREPASRAPQFVTGAAEARVTVVETPPRTVARTEWEYRRRWSSP
jgi:hypothetical protein